ncbi:MAG TPA: hypothetical protein VFN21_11065 [Acidimicrobiales bacterium]|nr:hypothetical protein [Acidimicrobiales bacterium]
MIGLGVAAALVVLFFGAVIALSLLGSQASTTFRAIPMSSNPVSELPDFTASTSSSVRVASAVDDPEPTLEEACGGVQPEQPIVSIPPGFAPLDAAGGGQYAHVVRVVDSKEDLVATVDLGTGNIEKSPMRTRLAGIGRDSAAVVCVSSDTTTTTRELVCGTNKLESNGTPFGYLVVSAETVRLQVFELASGRALGTGEVVAGGATCPSDYTKIETDDVDAEYARLDAASKLIYFESVAPTDDQLARWTADHLKGGTYH